MGTSEEGCFETSFFFGGSFKYNFFSGRLPAKKHHFFGQKLYYLQSIYISLTHSTYSLRVKNGSSPRPTRAKLLRRTASYSKLFSSPLVVCFVCRITFDTVRSRFDLVNLFTKLGYVHYASRL